MKKQLIQICVALSALLPTASAIAADLDTLPPPPVANLRPATYDWSGFYAGVWTGTACLNGTLTDNGTGSTWLNAGCGFKGGGLAGYNQQFGSYVIGGEFDIGTTTTIVNNIDAGANYNMKLDYLASLRARAGWAMDDTLFYITAGGAWAQGDINGTAPAVTPNNLTGQEYGWTVGAGMEHAVTDKFRLRLEYMYTHMADAHYSTGCGTCNVDIHWGDEHEAKVAAIWAF
ncbi:MAG: porin family protein [Alphaproteobacteria bacterium]|nr:porin family protein [Alphaproteobacteria bacterium]